MLSTDRIDAYNNPYWQNTTSALISAALTMLASRRKRTSFSEAVEFMRAWFIQIEGAAMPKAVTDILETARRKAAKPGATSQLRIAMDHVLVWRHLDQRTKSNLQSCLLNVIGGISGVAATRSFEAKDRPAFHPGCVVTENKICTVSANALTDPHFTKFIMRLARRQFFDAVHARCQNERRLKSALIVDEFPLIVQPEDADQLATLRSKGCSVLAATQGLAGLDEKIGQRSRRSILHNFNTILFMRTREQEAGEFATLSLAARPRRSTRYLDNQWMDTDVALVARRAFNSQPLPVCPPGALGQLQPHQAYVLKADGSRTLHPVWFVPWFERTNARLVPTQKKRTQRFTVGAEDIERLLQSSRHVAVLSSEVLTAALKLDANLYERALSQAREFFSRKACMIPEGLESLPASWLAGLPGILWARRKPHWTLLPFMIRTVTCSDGILLLDFAQEGRRVNSFNAWDKIRVAVNCCIYPNRWRPLLRVHRMALWNERPELRPQLRANDFDLN